MTPASIRNNNPGAAEPGFASKRFGSTRYEQLRWRDASGTLRHNRIATFPTPVHGAASNFYLLCHGRHYRNKTIRDAITTWCGGYSARAYSKALEARAGLTADTILTPELVRDPAFAVPLLRAMAKWEAGRDFPMPDDDWHQAHAMAFGDAAAPAPSPDNDVPTQKPEGRRREVVAKVAKGVGVAGTVGVVVDAATDTVGAVRTIVPPVPKAVTENLTNIGAIKDTSNTALSLGREAWHLAWSFPIFAGLVVLLIAALFFFKREAA